MFACILYVCVCRDVCVHVNLSVVAVDIFPGCRSVENEGYNSRISHIQTKISLSSRSNTYKLINIICAALYIASVLAQNRGLYGIRFHWVQYSSLLILFILDKGMFRNTGPLCFVFLDQSKMTRGLALGLCRYDVLLSIEECLLWLCIYTRNGPISCP